MWSTWTRTAASRAVGHLDLPAIEQLESALGAYRGTLLLVTHDRRLLDAVTLTRELRT